MRPRIILFGLAAIIIVSLIVAGTRRPAAGRFPVVRLARLSRSLP